MNFPIYDPADWYWFVGDDRSQVYASRRAKMVPTADEEYAAWLKNPNGVSRAASQTTLDDVIEILRANNVPPYHRVAKSTMISRLTDQQLEQAVAMMTVRQQERWRAPDQPAINSDDLEALAIIQAVGADPAVVMAPE